MPYPVVPYNLLANTPNLYLGLIGAHFHALLYNIVCKNKYDYIYAMTKKQLIKHINKQNVIIKELKNEYTTNVRIAMNKIKNEPIHRIKSLLSKNKKSKIRRTINNY